ncbi:MAG TPA: hypothetical protein VM008_04430 [Phycisphaerae bacterium]|nr:hypothetical protein [Phycisphaerae bacterium]
MSTLGESYSVQEDATNALRGLSHALCAMLTAISGGIRRPTDLQNSLGLDYKICWQVCTIARSNDPLSVAHHVPGAFSMKRLIAAAAAKGVPKSVLVRVEQAADDFNHVVAKHADARATFDAMLSALTGSEAGDSLAFQHRRNAYRAESQIWGTQLHVMLLQNFVHRCSDGVTVDTCTVITKVGQRRLRPNVPLVCRGQRQANALAADSHPLIEPLEPESNELYGAPILKDFCSQPLPKFKTSILNNGWMHTTIDSDEVGRRSAVDFSFGTITRNAPTFSDGEGRRIAHHGTIAKTPTETAILEMFVHQPSFGDVEPKLVIHPSQPDDALPHLLHEPSPFQLQAKFDFLGTADLLAPSADIPRYPQQVEHVFRLLDWNPQEFALYRVRIAYPILHAVAHLWFSFGNP